MIVSCPSCGAPVEVGQAGASCKYCGAFVAPPSPSVPKNKCPGCGYELEPNSSNAFCPYCGAPLKSGHSHRLSNSNEAEERAKALIDECVSSVNDEEEFAEKRNAARDVYESSVAGVCIIQNIEGSCSGSGFIYKRDGLVITNAHVIYYDEENRPSQKLNVIVNGRKYEASVVNSNSPEGDDDIALLKIKSGDLFHELETGNIKNVRNGDEVIAIGNPKGEGLSITRGIVSDVCRRYGNECYLMSDVTINPGNSGGPLFNEKGQVIAICVSSRVEADNMNFFIPINHVLEYVHSWGY